MLMQRSTWTHCLRDTIERSTCRGEMCNLIIFCGIYWLFNAINVEPSARKSHQTNYCYFFDVFFSSSRIAQFNDRWWSNFQIDPLHIWTSWMCWGWWDQKKKERWDIEAWEQRILPIQLMSSKLFNAITQRGCNVCDHLIIIKLYDFIYEMIHAQKWLKMCFFTTVKPDPHQATHAERERKSWEFFISMLRRLIFFVCRSTSIVFCASIRRVDEQRRIALETKTTSATKTCKNLNFCSHTNDNSF